MEEEEKEPVVGQHEAVLDDFLENPPELETESGSTTDAPKAPDDVVDDFLENPKDEGDDEEKKDDESKGDEGKSEKKTQFSFRGFANKAGSAASAAHDQIAALPTPGGIGILIFALIFFVWAIVPVDQAGNTRLHLLWLTLTGHTVVNQGAIGEAPPEVGPGGSTAPTTGTTTGTTGTTTGTTGMGDGGVPLFYASPFDFGVM